MTDVAGEATPRDTVAGIARDRWDYLPRYVGENWPRYEATAAAMREGKRGVSWSWSAFLVTELWLTYRRRYAWTALLLAFTAIATIGLGSNMGDDVLLAVRVLMGIFGKSLYLRDGLRRIDRIIDTVPDEQERLKRVDFAGGASANSVIVLILLMFVAIGVIAWSILSNTSPQAMP